MALSKGAKKYLATCWDAKTVKELDPMAINAILENIDLERYPGEYVYDREIIAASRLRKCSICGLFHRSHEDCRVASQYNQGLVERLYDSGWQPYSNAARLRERRAYLQQKLAGVDGRKSVSRI